MRENLLQLVEEELRLLRAEGVEAVSISRETLASLSAPRSIPPQKDKEGGTSVAPSSAPQIDLSHSKPSRPTGGAVSQAVAVDPQLAKIPEITIPSGTKQEKWDWLRERVMGCEVCQAKLNPGKKVVFGTGNLDADILFCGEAPGADEETKGLPFVGPAGQLLDGMIKAMNLSREDVYIANIMNWRPQTGTPYGNRPPSEQEMAFCLPYLKAQIEIVRPKIIVALGGTAAKGLLGIETKGRMAQLRGTWHKLGPTPLTITYHPSFLLHQDSLASKRKVWEDLMKVMESLQMPISEKQKNFFLGALQKK